MIHQDDPMTQSRPSFERIERPLDRMSRDEWQVAPVFDQLWYRAQGRSRRRLPASGAIAVTI